MLYRVLIHFWEKMLLFRSINLIDRNRTIFLVSILSARVFYAHLSICASENGTGYFENSRLDLLIGSQSFTGKFSCFEIEIYGYYRRYTSLSFHRGEI